MATRNGFKYNHQTQALELYVNGKQVTSFAQSQAKTYYVNYATGSDTNDGLSWGTAFKQVNAAIIASEATRKVTWTNPSTGVVYSSTYDQNCRNQIIIQGVNADYDAVSYTTNTTEPYFTDIYGLSGYQRATLMGQVVIGHHDNSKRALYMYAPLGTNMYNLQFEGGTASLYCAVVANAIGCQWLDCSFVAYTGGIGAFSTTGTFCGNHIDGCMFESAGGGGTYVFVNSGENSSDNLIENSIFISTGTYTNSIKWVGWGVGDLIRNCNFSGPGTTAVGIADTSGCGIAVQSCYFGSNFTDCISNTHAGDVSNIMHANALETL